MLQVGYKQLLLLLLCSFTTIVLANQPMYSIAKNIQPKSFTEKALLFPSSNPTNNNSKLTITGKNLTIAGGALTFVGGVMGLIGYSQLSSKKQQQYDTSKTLITFFGGIGLASLGVACLLPGGIIWTIGTIKDKAHLNRQRKAYIGISSTGQLALTLDF
jgi:hypothetical protein